MLDNDTDTINVNKKPIILNLLPLNVFLISLSFIVSLNTKNNIVNINNTKKTKPLTMLYNSTTIVNENSTEKKEPINAGIKTRLFNLESLL